MLLWLVKRDVSVPTVGKFITRRAPVGALGGLWAMIPDIDYFQEDHMFDKPWADIFLFHHSFDLVLPETDLFFAAEMFLLFAVVNLFAMVASVQTMERLNEALFGKINEEEDGEEDSPGDAGKKEAELTKKETHEETEEDGSSPDTGDDKSD
jgi:hypothetical protein